MEIVIAIFNIELNIWLFPNISSPFERSVSFLDFIDNSIKVNLARIFFILFSASLL